MFDEDSILGELNECLREVLTSVPSLLNKHRHSINRSTGLLWSFI